MQNLELKLEAGTPLFLTGADGKIPELRSASFRGALRFWLRALLGAYIGNDIERLQNEESAIFGSTNGSSPVIVHSKSWTKSLKEEDRRVLPHSKDRGKMFKSPAFIEGSQFALKISVRRGRPDIPKKAIAALLLFLNFGGIGKRSRRGFGSLRVINILSDNLAPSIDPYFLNTIPADGIALVEHLKEVLTWTFDVVDIDYKSGSSFGSHQLPLYPLFSSYNAKILVCQHAFSRSDYQQAMVDFWNKLRSNPFRSNRAYGYANGGRRASPLILHIWPTQAGHHLVLTAFRSKPSPEGERGWSLVNDFLEDCRQEWRGEYLLGEAIKW